MCMDVFIGRNHFLLEFIEKEIRGMHQEIRETPV